MSLQLLDRRIRRGKKRSFQAQQMTADPKAITAGSPDHLATRWVATDQSGRRVIVLPLSEQGQNVEKGKQLRFVLMRQAELAPKQKPYPKDSIRRTRKPSSRQRAALVVPDESLSPVDHVEAYAIHELIAAKPPFAALTFQAPTNDLREQIRDIYIPLAELAMQHEELYHALLTTALAFKEIRGGRLAITPALLRHSHRSVTCLRNKISRLDTIPDDAVMLTTTLLTDAATKYGTRMEIVAHYSGLRKMIRMRGGSKEMRGNIALMAMLEYVNIVADLLGFPTEGELIGEGGTCFSSDAESERSCLHYPVHPFPGSLCSDVADLPEGFRELALSLGLSREVIKLIIAANQQAFSVTKEFKSCPSMVMTFSRRFLQASSRVTESIVCLSVIVAFMRSVSFPFSTEDLDLVTELSLLVKERGFEESSIDQYHHYVWTVIMTAEACQHESSLSTITSRLLHDLLMPIVRNDKSAPDVLTDWAKLQKVLKKYLWKQDMLDKWENLWEISIRELQTKRPQETEMRILVS
ncbi:hypothetical protein H2200_002356 [Cladophialophora chaetospira]|uniref:Uncharacterized protein n=1 Tax=Cladophialophora chaetospira TaxID=386627 RepID=A0AA38XIR0_9EURO|nr:hypothetical protein H2200_002356 [Cladophialophora chaetospira]